MTYRMYGTTGRMKMKTETRVKLKNLKDKCVNKYTIAVLCVIAAALIIWAVISVVGYYTIEEDNPRNNEIANSGFSIEYNDRIIASLGPVSSINSDPDKVDLGIISTDANGSDMKILRSDYAVYLNTDGTYVYYINNSDNGSVYRMKPDGTECEKIIDIYAGSMIYDNGYLYIYRADNKSVVKYSTTDFKETVLAEHGATTNLSITGDKLYFFWIDGDKRKIASVGKNGGNIKYYGESSSGYGLVSHKGYLYYIDEAKLYRVKIGSKNSHKVSEEIIYRFFIEDEKIYYLASESASDSGAFVMELNGKNSKPVCKGTMRTLSVAQGKLLSISLGYESEPFLYFIDAQTGAIMETYDMIDEEKRTQEIYAKSEE